MNIAQSFILMKNIKKWVWIGGGKICGVLFFKERAFFDQYQMLS